eukprot:TRINITY_DN23237_c0_g1_i1.p1 TRINITY_DN23237_c0_g1~~TRINITY_DN23237_c0_g1_i1.p1  ORF type:complete len:300 (-),score=89.88 TRINITY_DN23237_c0_g1_i1:6-905(-)
MQSPKGQHKGLNIKNRLSRTFAKSDDSIVLPEEKLTITDTPVVDGESWPVKIKTQGGSKVHRVMVVGKAGCQFLLPKTLEEVENIPFPQMNTFGYCQEYKVFQISWFITNPTSGKKEIQNMNITSKNPHQINDVMQKYLKMELQVKAQKALARKSLNPQTLAAGASQEIVEELMDKCTYNRSTNVEELKKGGRFSNDEVSALRAGKHSSRLLHDLEHLKDLPGTAQEDRRAKSSEEVTGLDELEVKLEVDGEVENVKPYRKKAQSFSITNFKKMTDNHHDDLHNKSIPQITINRSEESH